MHDFVHLSKSSTSNQWKSPLKTSALEPRVALVELGQALQASGLP